MLPFLALLAYPASGHEGVAQGRVGLIDTSTQAYAFSTYSGEWTLTLLDSPALVRRAGSYLGYLRTSGRIYAFNSTNDRWFNRSFDGLPRGEDVQGACCVFWTNRACYAIASIWTLWFEQLFDLGDVPRGGGSAGNFALVWTMNTAYAFHAATGQWMRQDLGGSALGGIARDGFGLVWTDAAAFAFDPTPGGWIALDLGGTQGISASGSGEVGLVWGRRQAQAFSGPLDAWFPVETQGRIEGGSAGGQIALLWDPDRAYAFDANTGLWHEAVLEEAAGMNGGMGGDLEMSVSPNPCMDGEVRIALQPGAVEGVRLYNAQGAEVRSWETSSADRPFTWDTRGADGRPVPSGIYWIRAERSDGGVESRRVVVVR